MLQPLVLASRERRGFASELPLLTSALVEARLRYPCAAGRLVRVRRGLYASCAVEWDPFVLAAKLAPDPIIAYERALAFHKLRGGDGSITVRYWRSLEDIAAWRRHADHATALRAGRERGYRTYAVRVAKVEREAFFPGP